MLFLHDESGKHSGTFTNTSTHSLANTVARAHTHKHNRYYLGNRDPVRK